MTRLIVLTLTLFCFSNNYALAEKRAIDWSKVGPWEIRIDPTMNNGCFLFAEFKEGSVFRLGFSNKNNKISSMYAMVTNVNWKSLELGKEYEIGLQFGNAQKWVGDATAFKMGSKNESIKTLVLPVPKKEMVTFSKEFMRKNYVKVFYRKEQIAHLSLKGTYKAFQEMIVCQDATNNKKKRFGNSVSDPFSGKSRESRSKDPFK